MIPKILFRTIPEKINEDNEMLWRRTSMLHPGWKRVTLQDPINPEDFPITSPHWAKCSNGAQKAGLIRLEYLHRHGGIYLDSDVELFRPLTPLLGFKAFAAYEDHFVIPDAVLGAEPGHPAITECMGLALGRLLGLTERKESDWVDGQGAWSTGPGVTTTVLKGREDVFLLPPSSFYPVFYAPRENLEQRLQEGRTNPPPWVYGMHLWNFSWAG